MYEAVLMNEHDEGNIIAFPLFRRKVLKISDGIDDMGPVKWDLALTLLFAWIVVYCCICKGIKTSGKVYKINYFMHTT